MGTQTTRQQILDAAFATLADVGLSRLALEDVAARAGVSRQTLYRHFGSRTGLVRAVIDREEDRVLAVVAAAGEAHTDLAPSLTAALTALLEWTRDHPLLATLLASEPEALLPLLTAGDAPVIAVARPAIAAVLRTRVPPGTAVDTAADVLARVMLSYAIDPPDGSPDQVASRLAALFVGGVTAMRP